MSPPQYLASNQPAEAFDLTDSHLNAAAKSLIVQSFQWVAFAFLLGILFVSIPDREGKKTSLKINTESVADNLPTQPSDAISKLSKSVKQFPKMVTVQANQELVTGDTSRNYAKMNRVDASRNWLADRTGYPERLSRLLRGPSSKEKVEEVERSYQRYEQQRALTTPPGFLVVGRVELENAAVDPRLVEARVPIESDGYFFDFVSEPGRTISFSLHGYHAVEVTPEGPKEFGQAIFVEDLGTITLKKIKRREQATLRGSIQLEGIRGPDIEGKTNVTMNVIPHGSNHANNQAIPRRSRDGEGITLKPLVKPNGIFNISELSPEPTTYRVMAHRDGYLPAVVDLQLKSGSNPITRLTLERRIPIGIEAIVWKDESFDVNDLRSAEILGGEYFELKPATIQVENRTSPKMGGMGPGMAGYFKVNRVEQREGRLFFELSDQLLTGCQMLGEGELSEFLDTDPLEQTRFDAREKELKHAHVYLIRGHAAGYSAGSYGPNPDARVRDTIIEKSQFTLVRVTIPHQQPKRR